jgi:RNA polymerase sigma-70 factor (ECF subfamily)
MQRRDLEAELGRHHTAAFGWALSCCGWDRDMAEDVLQDSYLKVLDGRARFRGQASFKTFLFAVIRRTGSEARRRNAVRKVLPLSRLERHEEVRSLSTDPGERVVRSESAAALLTALRALPRRQREVLHLVFHEDLSIAGAAEVLGVSLGTARTHYERGKAHLRLVLGREEKE